MRNRMVLVGTGLVVAAGWLARSSDPVRAGGVPGTDCASSVGGDVIVGAIMNEVTNFPAEGGIDAFAIGTYSCNIGDEDLLWEATNNLHPVITQNLFRFKDGRFEQIGQAWAKHGFFAAQSLLCCPECDSSGTGDRLGPGCADPYHSVTNSVQFGMGPKHEVDPHTGIFPYPPANPPFSGAMARRLQARISDLDPAWNGGGMYFAESQYVSPDDAAAGNQNNNASYRQIGVTGGCGEFDLTTAGMPPTVREAAAIRAWQDHDPAVFETDVQVPGDGLVIMAARVTDLGDGWHHYEYAVQNLNVARAFGSFSVPVNPAAIIANPGFHDVQYHSGEPYDGTDWSVAVSAGAVTWSTDDFAANDDANALRWGTLYNFRFDSTAPPAGVTATLGLFEPGTPASVTAATLGPDPGPADCDGNGVDDLDDIAGGAADCDANGILDACEPDCDANGTIDACETDTDADGVPDACDNCPLEPNADQADQDADGVGDACDGDYCDRVVLGDDFEVDLGWTTEILGATSGFWDRGVPVADPAWPHAPTEDADGSGQCYLTGNVPGNSDLDDGSVRLISPALDLTTGPATIRYAYFLRLFNDDGTDAMVVEISEDDLAGPWTEIERHDDDQGLLWVNHAITPGDLDAAGVTRTATMRIRFTVNDGNPQSLVEAGLDAVVVSTAGCFVDCNGNGRADALDIESGESADRDGNGTPDECEPDCNGNGVPDPCDLLDNTSADCNANGVPDECDVASGTSKDCDLDGVPDDCGPCAADLDCSGQVDFPDLLRVLLGWGPCGACPADIDGNGVVGFEDLLAVLTNWGPC